MPTYELEESTWAGPVPEDTILTAKVTGIKEVQKDEWENGAKTGGKVTRLEFSFIIEDPDSAWDGQKLWGETSTVFSNNEKCKLYNWSKEVLGVDEFPLHGPDGRKFSLDTDVLVGESCRVIVGAREYQKDGEDKVYNFAKDVIRASSKMGSRAVDEPEPF